MDEELRSLNPRVHCVSGQIQSTSSLPRSQICLQVVDKGGTSAANDPSAVTGFHNLLCETPQTWFRFPVYVEPDFLVEYKQTNFIYLSIISK